MILLYIYSLSVVIQLYIHITELCVVHLKHYKSTMLPFFNKMRYGKI